MREGTAPLVRREDYAPPPFLVRKVDLTFDLDPAKTLVTNRMQIERNAAVAPAPLKLHGKDITLTRCLANGQPVSFRHEDGLLVIDNVPDGSFTLPAEYQQKTPELVTAWRDHCGRYNPSGHIDVHG